MLNFLLDFDLQIVVVVGTTGCQADTKKTEIVQPLLPIPEKYSTNFLGLKNIIKFCQMKHSSIIIIHLVLAGDKTKIPLFY